jgi:hypothetical protein
MNSGDIVGFSIILLVLLSGLYGLYRISRPIPYTKEEYEKRLNKGSGIARGAMNAMLYPFEELLHPKIVESIHVMKDMKAGYYNEQQANGDSFDENSPIIPEVCERQEIHRVRIRKNRIGNLLRRVASAFRLRQ